MRSQPFFLPQTDQILLKLFHPLLDTPCSRFLELSGTFRNFPSDFRIIHHWRTTHCSCNKITTTWIWFYHKSWNCFFSNISHQMIILCLSYFITAVMPNMNFTSWMDTNFMFCSFHFGNFVFCILVIFCLFIFFLKYAFCKARRARRKMKKYKK